jgi:hypothetical protein
MVCWWVLVHYGRIMAGKCVGARGLGGRQGLGFRQVFYPDIPMGRYKVNIYLPQLVNFVAANLLITLLKW